jgi:heme O synthase-like polyprenyltransferase
VPPAWLPAVIALAAGAAIEFIPQHAGWAAVAGMLAVDLVFLAIVATLSRDPGWTPLHTLSLAAGGAIVYGVHAFTMKPFGASTRVVGWIGNGVFLAIAIAIVAIGMKRTRAVVAPEVSTPLVA